MTRRLWLVNLLLAVGCSSIGGLDLAIGHPMMAPLMFASAGVNGLVGVFNKRHYARPPEPPHRPDYAKIRTLELELGLTDPDPVPEPVVRVTRVDQIRHAPRIPQRTEIQQGTTTFVYDGVPGLGTLVGLRGDWADVDPFGNSVRDVALSQARPRPSDWQRYQARPRVVPPAVTSVNEWAYCPVCTRRHAGRCAG